MTLPTIQAGKTYKVLPSAPFDYPSGGRLRTRGIPFTADMGDQNATWLSIGMTRGHVVEIFDVGASIAARAAEAAQTIADNNDFTEAASDGHIVAQEARSAAALNTSLLSALTSTITVDPVAADQLEVTGSVTVSGKFRALLNSVIDGTVFTVGAPGAFSHTFVGNPVSSDVVGVQAMLDDGVTVASDPVNVTVGASTVTLSPVTAGDTIVTFSLSVGGTYQAQINAVDSGASAVKTAGSGRTLTFGAPPVGGNTVGVYETTVPVSEPVTTTVKFTAPAITAGSTAGQTSVSGTTTSTANGTLITLFVNGTSAGTTTVTANAWTVSPITALVVGNALTAKAGSGAAQSAASASVAITQETAPVVDSPIVDAATTVTGTSNGADSLAIEVFSDNPAPDTSIGATTVVSGVWTAMVTAVATGDSITAKAGTGGAASAASSAVVVTP